MATTVGMETNLVDLLNNLIELDFDAIEAYKAAISRVDDMSDRAQLARFLEDHQRHVADLSPLVERLGGVPAMGGRSQADPDQGQGRARRPRGRPGRPRGDEDKRG